jgi:predicted nuclease of predicted toxin-antitoxin system
MRLLADENIPLESVRALRDAGHDVYAASEGVRGEPDERHLARAIAEDRLIVTFDRDFGELVTRGTARPEIDWRNHLSVVDRAHVRQRRI